MPFRTSNCFAHSDDKLDITNVPKQIHFFVCLPVTGHLITLFWCLLLLFCPNVFIALSSSYSTRPDCCHFCLVKYDNVFSSPTACLGSVAKTKPPAMTVCRYTAHNKSLEWLSYPAPERLCMVKRGQKANTACFEIKWSRKPNIRPG